MVIGCLAGLACARRGARRRAGAAETCTGGGGQVFSPSRTTVIDALHDVVEVEDELRRPCPG